MIFQANGQVELKQPRELQPNASNYYIILLSQVPYGCLLLFSKKQYSKNDQIQVLNDLTKLLELVIK